MTTEYLALEKLPEEHPLRNAPLASIKAEFQRKSNGSDWKAVEERGIGAESFNDLYDDGVWRRFHIWRAPSSNGDDDEHR